MSKTKVYDIAKGDTYKIMGEQVTGVNKIIEHRVEVSMDGKTQAWRDAADRLLETLAVTNKYVVSDMMIIFLESAGYGLSDYSPLGGVFKRAAAKGIIKRVDRQTKQALWMSQVYNERHSDIPHLVEGEIVKFKNFGQIDHVTFQIAEVTGEHVKLKRVE